MNRPDKRTLIIAAVLVAVAIVAGIVFAQPPTARWFDGPNDSRPTPQIERTHNPNGDWVIATQRGTRRVNIYIRRRVIHGLTVHEARENPAFNTPFVNINVAGRDFRFDVKNWEDGVNFCREIIGGDDAPAPSDDEKNDAK